LELIIFRAFQKRIPSELPVMRSHCIVACKVKGSGRKTGLGRAETIFFEGVLLAQAEFR
jgi:hypothetical protein